VLKNILEEELGMKVLEKAHYVFQTIGGTYKVIKDRFGDFDLNYPTDYKTVKKYFDSGYDVAILDQDGNINMKNFQ
jgi:hypothetical protein